jgi:hypothetical protein
LIVVVSDIHADFRRGRPAICVSRRVFSIPNEIHQRHLDFSSSV